MAARATHCEFRAVGIGESTRLRTVTLPNGDLIRYHLDAQNRRIAKDKNGVRQYGLLWLDSLRPIAELDASGQLRSVFHYAEHANVPSAMERDGKLYRILHDHLGSVRLVVQLRVAVETLSALPPRRHRRHQPLCRRVAGAAIALGDGVGHFLAKLDAELVEAVDAPDPALHENLVLVGRHELAKGER